MFIEVGKEKREERGGGEEIRGYPRDMSYLCHLDGSSRLRQTNHTVHAQVLDVTHIFIPPTQGQGSTSTYTHHASRRPYGHHPLPSIPDRT